MTTATGTAQVDLVYAVRSEALSSVFTSQVLARLSGFGEGLAIEVVVLTPIGQRLRPKWRRLTNGLVETARSSHNLTLRYLPSPPTRAQWLWDEGRMFCQWLRRRYGSQPVVVQCRNAPMTALAIAARQRLPHLRVIFDCRGALADEFLNEHRLEETGRARWAPDARQTYDELHRSEALAARESDAVFCVSHAMVDLLRARYDVPEDRFTMVPCCVSDGALAGRPESRQQLRSSLGLADRLVVVYSGSLAWYQLPAESLRVFRLLQRIHPSAHFLALTTDPDRMQVQLRQAGITGGAATVLSLAPEAVPDYLAAADLGLLLRESTLLNRVASPVKFGEYLASGTPVILTDGIGDYSAMAKSHRLGIVVELGQDDSRLEAQLRSGTEATDMLEPRARERCRSFAATHLCWRRYLPTVRSVYDRLAGAP